MKKILLALTLLLAALPVFAGAWGADSFDNDDALDWVAQCVHTRDISAISDMLNAALKAEVIEASDGAAALAAIEVVAAALGKPGKHLPDALRAWMRQMPTTQIAQLAPLARTVIGRIEDGKRSELKQLWSEGKPNQWTANVADLSARINN
jgi:hypothetical protein